MNFKDYRPGDKFCIYIDGFYGIYKLFQDRFPSIIDTEDAKPDWYLCSVLVTPLKKEKFIPHFPYSEAYNSLEQGEEKEKLRNYKTYIYTINKRIVLTEKIS